MREVTLVSGKGGTGKTSLTAALAHLAAVEAPPVVCDLDVDASDLHLLLNPAVEHTEDFVSGHEAVIIPGLCTACGVCADRCRFGAVISGETFRIDPMHCEGCGVCAHFCPTGAAQMVRRHCGRWYRSQTRFGPLVHAHLFPGQENSGRLVSLLREEARRVALAGGHRWLLADGAPGIGCPVISSLTGTDLAVVVTEPTPSGRHDLERIVNLAHHFDVPTALVVNKADLNPELTLDAEAWARAQGVSVLGRLPYDAAFTEAVIRHQVLSEHAHGQLADALAQIWDTLQGLPGPLRAA